MLSARVYVAALAAGLAAAGHLFFSSLPAAWPGAATPAPRAVPAAAAARGPARVLADTGALDGFPDWSPDGQRLAFMRDGQIWLMQADGQGARAVTQTEQAWDVSPVWSPDGARIAFIRYLDQGKGQATPAALMLVRPDGGGEQEVVKEEGLLGYVAWHPQGQALAYSTARRLVVHDLRRGRQQVLVELGEEADLLPGGVAWSPDGQHLVYGAGRKAQVAGRPELDLYRIPAAGGAPERLTSGGGQLPDFSPDGTRLAFRNPRQPGGILVLDLASGQVSGVIQDDEKYLYFHPRWAPDGRTLAASRLHLGRSRGGAMHLTSAIIVIQ